MITIELHLESETLMVHADMEQIQQVLYNLLTMQSNSVMTIPRSTLKHP